MQLLILLLVFAGTMLLMVGTYAFLNRRRLAEAEALRARLTGVQPVGPINIFRDDSVSGLAFLNRLLAGKSFTEMLAIELRKAGSTQKVGEFVLTTALAFTVGFFIGRMMGLAFGFLLGVMVATVPWLALKRKQATRMAKFEEQLPDALDMLVNALKAGYSLQAAMEFVGKEMPEPLGPEFGRFYDEQRLGMDVRTALLGLQERVGTTDIKMFVTSLLIQRETGGNLSEVLSNLAKLMRERVTFRGEVKTLTAEPKFSARMMAGLPLAMFLLLTVLNRDFEKTLWTTPIGRVMLLFSVVSVMIGYFIMSRMARIEI
ncbi:MAG TPA: type II secretion system F family protein [Gemmatimonadaceae bacterium]|nr:type II secretion system F family protein [Gemmatimonadaceae bacterium]